MFVLVCLVSCPCLPTGGLTDLCELVNHPVVTDGPLIHLPCLTVK